MSTRRGPLSDADLRALYNERNPSEAGIYRHPDLIADWAERQPDIEIGTDRCFYQVTP